MTWRGGRAILDSAGGATVRASADPFSLLRGLLAEDPVGPAPPWPFSPGCVGFFSYDAGRALERLPSRAEDDREIAGADFAFHTWSIQWDHRLRRWAVVGRERGECERAAEWALGAAAPPRGAGEGRGVDLVPTSSLDRRRYLEAVERIKERIAAGDCYEVNLSRRLAFAGKVDARRLFTLLTRVSPAPFAAYLEAGDAVLVGSSPERFLRVCQGWAESRPIKGTAARDADPGLDSRAAADLAASPKDRAENVMIVDLVRHDLGRVCRPGSIEVERLCAVESYAAVHHLVSTVRGRLRSGVHALDAARALFPPGSMTGAPKIRSMEIIEALEPVRRGPYAGAAGYLSACGAADLSVIIRTFVISRSALDLQVGGAVTADSDPAGEYEESEIKGRRALEALGRAEGEPAQGAEESVSFPFGRPGAVSWPG